MRNRVLVATVALFLNCVIAFTIMMHKLSVDDQSTDRVLSTCFLYFYPVLKVLNIEYIYNPLPFIIIACVTYGHQKALDKRELKDTTNTRNTSMYIFNDYCENSKFSSKLYLSLFDGSFIFQFIMHRWEYFESLPFGICLPILTMRHHYTRNLGV